MRANASQHEPKLFSIVLVLVSSSSSFLPRRLFFLKRKGELRRAMPIQGEPGKVVASGILPDSDGGILPPVQLTSDH